MLTDDGIIFNIDFGFILNDEPKRIGGYRLAPEIKWNEKIAEPLIENASNLRNPFKDAGYNKLMEACTEGFLSLQSNTYLTRIEIFEFYYFRAFKYFNKYF